MATKNGGAKTHKPYVRTMTEKRREQNRRAQKTYREKLKQRLDSLEDEVAAVEGETKGPFRTHPEHPSAKTDCNEATSIITFDDILAAGGDLAGPAISSASTLPVGTAWSPPRPPQDVQLASTGQQSQTFAPPNDSSFPHWHMPYRPVGTPYLPPATATSSYMTGALTVVTPDYAYNHQKRLLLDHAQGRSTNTPLSVNDGNLKSSSPFSLLSVPFTNHLSLISHSNVSACLSIGLSLGISNDDYLKDAPSPFPRCFEEITSIVAPSSTLELGLNSSFRRLLVGDDHEDDVRDTSSTGNKLREHMLRVKQPLRPHPIQFLAHPSYLDCIIFPKLRERAVQASVDGTLDHVEFFLDLMHGGLVCWGSANPQGNSKKRRNKRGMEQQVAWSTRNWEAKRWFLEKWSSLVGTKEEEEAEGEKDGVWACSRFWWGMRGEMDSDEEENEEEEPADRSHIEGLDGRLEGSEQYCIDHLTYEWGRGPQQRVTSVG